MIATIIEHISLSAIAVYYFIFSMVFYVVTLPFVVIKYLKDDQIAGKALAYVKSLFARKEKNDGKDDAAVKDDAKSASKKTVDKELEESEDEDVSHIILRVGDEYRCLLNEYDRKHINTDCKWTSTDCFAGSFSEDEKNVFKAEKVGVAYLEYGGMRIYKMEIAPRDKDWKFRGYVTEMLRGICDAQIKSTHLSDKINGFKFVDGNRLENIGYYIKPQDIELKYHFNSKGNADIMLIKANGINYEDTLSHLTDYFSMLDKKPDTEHVLLFHKWEKKNIDFSESGIDYVAIVERDRKGRVILGIAKSWRHNADEEEIRSNRQMVLRLFAEMLPDMISNVDLKPLKEIEKKEPAKRPEEVEIPAVVPQSTEPEDNAQPEDGTPAEVGPDTGDGQTEEGNNDAGETYEEENYTPEGQVEDFDESEAENSIDMAEIADETDDPMAQINESE